MKLRTCYGLRLEWACGSEGGGGGKGWGRCESGVQGVDGAMGKGRLGAVYAWRVAVCCGRWSQGEVVGELLRGGRIWVRRKGNGKAARDTWKPAEGASVKAVRAMETVGEMGPQEGEGKARARCTLCGPLFR